MSERLGFLCALAFVVVAALRDVYFGATLQARSPLHVAVIAFTLLTLVFLSVSLVRRQRLGALRPWARELVAINLTSAVAWIAYLCALKHLEPSLVQTLWAGAGPLSVTWLQAAGIGLATPVPLAPRERLFHRGILVSLALVTLVVATGRSGTGPHPQGIPMLGVALALVSGVSISINVLLCKRLNEHGIGPAAILAVRFVGVVVVAALLALMVGDTALDAWSLEALGAVAGVSLLLIVAPIYVNQVGIALASAITVRVVMALGPVLVFLLQLGEGRLRASGHSLAVIILYGVFAVLATWARRRSFSAPP